MTRDIDQTRLRECLDYDPDTGIFRWRVKVSQKVNVGQRAGTVSHGYRRITIDGVRYYEQRLAFIYVNGACDAASDIDHINRNGEDNRIINLRIATHGENCRNRNLSAASSSGVPGVHFYKRYQRYAAEIKINYRRIFLGYFDRLDDAASARAQAEAKYYGEFAVSI